MKLLGWTIIAAGLVAVGLVACTVTSEDPDPTDGGTGGTAGAAGAANGGTAGAATGGTAGAATGGTAGAATGGTAGAAGAPVCESAGDSGDPCALCMDKDCCPQQVACWNDLGSAGDTGATWDDKCEEVWNCAVDCYANGEAGTFQACLGQCTTDNDPANQLYTCLYVDKCSAVCQ